MHWYGLVPVAREQRVEATDFPTVWDWYSTVLRSLVCRCSPPGKASDDPS